LIEENFEYIFGEGTAEVPSFFVGALLNFFSSLLKVFKFFILWMLFIKNVAYKN